MKCFCFNTFVACAATSDPFFKVKKRHAYFNVKRQSVFYSQSINIVQLKLKDVANVTLGFFGGFFL